MKWNQLEHRISLHTNTQRALALQSSIEFCIELIAIAQSFQIKNHYRIIFDFFFLLFYIGKLTMNVKCQNFTTSAKEMS